MKNRILLGAMALFSLSATAGTSEFVPLQQRAQGQSLAGASLLNDSLFSNPASSAFTTTYSVDGTFLSPKTFSVSVLDTRTSAVGGALGYYRLQRPGTDKFVQAAKLGVSARLSENIGIGFATKALWGPDLAGNDAQYKDVDWGMLAKFSFVQLGLNVNNVFGGNAAMGEQREYALGARVNWEETLFLAASVAGETQTFRPVQYGIGAEYISPYYFALKGGFRLRPQDNRSYWSGGFSILSPKVSIHYAVEFENQPAGGVEHSVGTTFLF